MANDIWTGNGASWSTPADWSASGPPASTDDVEIASGTAPIDPPQSAVTVNSLTVDANAELDVAADSLTVTGDVSNSGFFVATQSTVVISGGFDNNGALQIDFNGVSDAANSTFYPPGGSTFTIDGTLTNEFNKFLEIGSIAPFGATLVKANAVANSGVLMLMGSPSVSTTLEITSAAGFGTAGEVSGEEVELNGNAVIQFDGGGQLTKIDAGAQLLLWFGGAINDQGVVGSNTALAGLTDVEGTLSLKDETLTTTTDLFIHNTQDGGSITSGVLDVDNDGTGGSTLTIGGKLIAHYAVQIGNAAMNTATLVKANEFDSSSLGQLSIHGGSFVAGGGHSPATATVEIASTAGFGTAGVLTGSVVMDGHALLEFDGGGSLASVASGAALGLYGPHAFIADTSDNTENSALTGLSSNAGSIDLVDVTLTTTGGFTNTGTFTQLSVDQNFTTVDGNTIRGGSNLTFGGTFNNDNAQFVIGSVNLTKATLVKVSALNNTGSLTIAGNWPDNSTELTADSLATLKIGSAAGFGAAGELTGSVTLIGDALIEFDGGNSLNKIDSGAFLEIEGQYASIADTPTSGAPVADSALTGLDTNAGQLDLQDHSLTLSGGLDNTGYMYVDNTYLINSDGHVASGGTNLTINGAFTNENYLTVGNHSFQPSAATLISADSLDNTSAGSITLEGNSSTVDATLAVGGASENQGTINFYSGGVLSIAAGSTFAEVHGSSMSGAGELDNSGTFVLGDGTAVGVAAIVNDGTIEVTTGSAKVGVAGGAISGTGTLLVGSGTTLEIAGSVDGATTLKFETDANIAQIDNLLDATTHQLFNAEIAHWGASDTVEINTNGLGSFGDITDATVGTYDSGSGLTSLVLGDSGSTVATLELKGDYTGWTFDVTQPATTPGYVSIDAVACYCRGTLIRTDQGDRKVEDLAIGDKLVTVSGAARPIKWIGTRSYGGLFIMGRKDILPICFKAGSIEDGLPRRDLFISPHHAMYLDGVLVEAKDLVNGRSIVQAEDVDRVDYFHIELDSHDVILAEGAWSETFVDDDSRGMFHNAQDYAALYPGEEARPACYYAPRLDTGFEVEALRRRLAQRAGLALGAFDARAGALRGHVDRVSDHSIEGWAQNPEHPEAPVCLDVYVGGRLVGRSLANLYREDLGAAGLGSGRHAFVFTVPDGLKLSAAAVEVRRSLDGAVLWYSTRGIAIAA